MIESRRRTSLLGVVALLGGIAAIVMPRLNLPGLPSVDLRLVHLTLVQAIAAGALLLALVAFLAAASSPRTNTLTPMLATIICIAAAALSFYPQLFHRPATLPVKPAPAIPSQNTAPSQNGSAPAPETGTEKHIKTIFDPDYKSPTPPPVDTKPPAKWTPPPLPAETAPPPLHRDVVGEIRTAREKQQAARAAVIRSLESASIYRDAKADADAAEADLKQARATYQPGSAELVAASQAALQARTKLEHILSAAYAKDSACQDADQQLKAALSAGPQ